MKLTELPKVLDPWYPGIDDWVAEVRINSGAVTLSSAKAVVEIKGVEERAGFILTDSIIGLHP